MAGVYNRKLFQKSPAREQLRNLGGIMASSDALLQEAMGRASAAPMPSAPAPVGMPPQPMGMPPAPMPMPPQPMGMPPQDPAIMPPDPMAGGMYDPMAGGSFMPPGMPPSAGMVPPVGYQEGGKVNAEVPVLTDRQKQLGILAAAGAGGFVPPMDLTDVTVPAGTVTSATPDVPAETATVLADEAAAIGETVDQETPDVTGQKLVDAVAPALGTEPSGDMLSDLAMIYEKLTGDLSGYEKNIDELNRGIIGAAIAAGTSARATQNIANGLLVGLQGSQATEERRAQAAQQLQQTVLQATAKGKSAGSQDYDSPIDAFRSIYSGIVNQGSDAVEVPEGMTLQDYAMDQAAQALVTMYTPEQLIGTQFEGLHERASAGAAPAPSTLSDAEISGILDQARAAVESGKSRAAVEDKLKSMGIDPGLL